MGKEKITVETIVTGSIDEVWEKYNAPADIEVWKHGSDDWYTKVVEYNLKEGGKYNYKMSSKDDTMSFNWTGEFTKVAPKEHIAHTMTDGRTVVVDFVTIGNQVKVTEVFEAESQNSIELQKMGWQSMLNNFKKHVEE